MVLADDISRARDPRTSPDELEQLATARRVAVRLAVAGNPSAPFRTLRLLAQDKNFGVRVALAECLHDSARRAAAQSDDPVVRIVVARHSDLTDEVTDLLAVDADPEVRETLAKHTESPETFRLLKADPVGAVRAGASENPCVSVQDLEALAGDPEPAVRAAVARSPRTPAALVERLATDPIAGVRSAAYDAMPLRSEVVENVRRTISRLASLGKAPFLADGRTKHPIGPISGGWMFRTKVPGEVEAFQLAQYLAWHSLMEEPRWRSWFSDHAGAFGASQARMWFEDRAELSIRRVGRPATVAVGVPVNALRESSDVVDYLRGVFISYLTRLAEVLGVPQPPRLDGP